FPPTLIAPSASATAASKAIPQMAQNVKNLQLWNLGLFEEPRRFLTRMRTMNREVSRSSPSPPLEERAGERRLIASFRKRSVVGPLNIHGSWEVLDIKSWGFSGCWMLIFGSSCAVHGKLGLEAWNFSGPWLLDLG